MIIVGYARLPEKNAWLLDKVIFTNAVLAPPAHAFDTGLAHTYKEAMPVASISRLAILHTTDDHLVHNTYTFARSIATAKLPVVQRHRYQIYCCIL